MTRHTLDLLWTATARHRSGFVLLVTLLLYPQLALGQYSLAVPTASSPPKTDHAERSLAAIDLAVIAAESGIMDVSLEAMKRAVGKGPPVSSIELGGLLSANPNPRARSSRGANAANQEAASAQAKMSRRLLRLHEIWTERELDPALAYAAWKGLILPAGRPNEAFAYSVGEPAGQSYSYSNLDFDFKQPKPSDCGAAALVQWAMLAHEEDDLRREMAARESLPGAASTVLLLKVILAQNEAGPVADAESLCETLATSPKLLVSDPDAKLLLGQVWTMLERVDSDSDARTKLLDAVLSATKSHPSWPANDWLQFLVSKALRESIKQGDAQQFQRIGDIAMSRYDRIRANNTDYVASREAAMYGEAAKRAFEAGHLELGADCLRSQSLIATSENYRSSQANVILNPNQAVAKNLLKMKPGRRYRLLSDLVWNMPALGLSDCARMNVSDPIPATFVTNLLTAKSRTPPSRQVAADGARSVSLLEWAMRDAIATGKEAEISERIAELEEKGSDDARLARLIFEFAQNKPLDLSLLSKTADDGTETLTPALGESGRVMPLDITIVEQALAQDDHSATGMKLADELLKVALDRHQDLFIAWLRYLKFQAEAAAGETPVTHHDLKHWAVSDDLAQGDFMAGHVPSSLWIERDGHAWGHQFGTHVSTMMIRYPIQGDFSISFRCKDGLYQEGGATFGGLTIEFLRYVGRIQIWGVGNRNLEYVETSAIKEGDFTDYRLSRQGDSLTLHIGDEFQQQVALPASGYPFFGMCSYHYRATTFDSLKIEGDVSIPRSVQMLSPTLLGWSTKFKGQRLPAVTFMPGAKSPAQKQSDKIEYDWQFLDGAIESVNHELLDPGKNATVDEAKPKWKRREGLIQYLRPLCDGEEISLEFYHEPGKLSLSPSVGRIAMLLSDTKLGLHWITADSGGNWTGIYNGNRVVDEEAEQLMPIALKTNDWNQLALRLDGEVVTLKLNGDAVYRRKWEAQAGRQFGLFHDPTKYHVRARNIRLRGDWPEKLPLDLFEAKKTQGLALAK